MKLIKLYEEIISLGGMFADKEGYISGRVLNEGNGNPVTIKGKRLVLPIKKQLQDPNWENRIVFHPLYENVLRGESEVVAKLRALILMRINTTLNLLSTALLQLAASHAEHSKLNPNQLEVLVALKNADEKTISNFASILKNIKASESKNNFVHIFLKRSGMAAGKKWSRVGVVTFPLFEALVKEDPVVTKGLRIKDKDTLKKLMEYFFPNILVNDAYNVGSDSTVAPYTDALLRTLINVIAPINDIINLFKDIMPDLADLEFDCNWVEKLDVLPTYQGEIKMIPMQPGNEGAVLIKDVSPQVEQPTQPTIVNSPPQIINPPPAPAVVQQHIQQPNYAWQANPQQQQFNQPMMNQMQQPMNQVVRTDKGVDFESILRSNPALNMSLNAGNVNMQQMPQQNMPRWSSAGFGNQMNNGMMNNGMMGNTMYNSNFNRGF